MGDGTPPGARPRRPFRGLLAPVLAFLRREREGQRVDPDDLELGCEIAGEVLQKNRTSDLVFSVPRLIAELSAILPLLPGDVIFTGTPEGVGATRKPPRFLQAGEVLHSWIEGIGSIRNAFVSE